MFLADITDKEFILKELTLCTLASLIYGNHKTHYILQHSECSIH